MSVAVRGSSRWSPSSSHWWRRIAVGIAGGLLLGALAFRYSPWPGALLIRSVFERNDRQVLEAMKKHRPGGVVCIADQPYRQTDPDATFDIYIPEDVSGTCTTLPTLIWTHGGAWVSGDKRDDGPYFELLAKEGYTVVALNYALGPERTYPTALYQLNDALAHLSANAEQYHIDREHLMMAGDSAGAQLTAQLATLVTNPGYARRLGLNPGITPEQLRAVVLYCGIYDMHAFLKDASWHNGGILGWGDGVAIWAYTGSRDRLSQAASEMSVIDHVTETFPPVFIAGGNADLLTDRHSRPLATKLKSLGVETETLFYPDGHTPALGHEYQFNLDNEDGKQALQRTLAFMARHLR